MKIDWDKTLRTVAAVAPTVATALGGPLAGMAVNVVAASLGIEASEAAISDAVATGNPEVFLKLKQAEQELTLKLKELDIQLENIAMQDRDSARRREAEVQDRAPRILGYGITVGFFGVIGYVLVNGLGISDPNVIGLIGILIGNVSSKVEQVYNYYFGSSAGSRRKSEQLTDIIKKPGQ